MSNSMDESLAQVLNDLPGRVTNQLLLGAIIESRTKLSAEMAELSERVEGFETRLTRVEQAIDVEKQNPSLVWLARNKPVDLIKVIVIILGIAGATHLPNWLGDIINLFGG